MMGINSRQKGKAGELELSKALRQYGYDCRRGQQYSGANGDADVVGLPGLHVECKRVEKLNLLDAMTQAKQDAKDGLFPTVIHRKNHSPWIVSIELENFMDIYREWEAGRSLKNDCS